VFITTFHRRSSQPLATLDLAIIKDILEYDQMRDHKYRTDYEYMSDDE
jgi:hypothetical protein